jgi:glycosyltransferase involved in cell wall biosynthesis
MKIAQIAPLWIPVPPRTYGGIELMLSLLLEELTARGHQVSLFSSKDSKTKAEIIVATEKALWLRKDLRSPHAVVIRLLKMVYDRRKDFDLIHNHFDFFMFPLLMGNSCPPVLTTLHRPLDEELARVARSFPKMNFCAISGDQRQSAKENNIPVVDVVYNGINPKDYIFNENPQDYYVYLGRLNKEKGIMSALHAAKQAGVKLMIAGNVVGGDEWNYFLHEVQPLLNEDNVNFIGQVDFNEKVKLLSNAKAMFFPIDRREPFGLVMIEAMACGTPVIAFNRGSVPEVIVDGKTGFIVENVDELVQSIKKIGSIKRKDCRTHVEKNFTLKQMVDKYEKVYKKLVS